MGQPSRCVRWPFHDNDRAQAEGKTAGLIKAVIGKRGKILGVGIVGAQAGELIQPWVLAMTEGLKISAIAGMVAPYPTLGDINRRVAVNYFSGLASNPWVRRVIRLIELETTCRAKANTRKQPGVLRGLSGKVLLLTIIFVMLGEILIFLPSIANFPHPVAEGTHCPG